MKNFIDLIDYFRNKKGKYLKLNNGEKVKLETVFANNYTMSLTFTHDNRTIYIPFDGLYGEDILMKIPHGLQSGVSISPYVKFDDLRRIGCALENVLINWTERKDEVLELNWEDWYNGTNDVRWIDELLAW